MEKKAANGVKTMGVVLCAVVWWSVIAMGTAAAQPDTARSGSGPEIEQEIRQTIRMQAGAVNAGDWERFKELLWENDRTYIQERKRWFEDAVSHIDRGTFQMEVESVAPYKPGLLLVNVRQHYKLDGVRHSVRLPLIYQQTARGWKDADLLFDTMTRKNVTVKFSDRLLSEKAKVALNVGEKALEAFNERLQWEPDAPIQIKLYHDIEVFRQSVKPSLPKWVVGWNERGQAIKFVGSLTADSNDETFASGIVHEISHRVISDMSHDNAAYWLQEGLAEYYQRHLLPGLHLEGDAQLKKPRWTLQQLEELNLESLSAREASLYYAHSYDVVRFFMREYGEKDLVEWCAALKMYPDIDQESAIKRRELNLRTREAFEKATNQPFREFARAWINQYENLK